MAAMWVEDAMVQIVVKPQDFPKSLCFSMCDLKDHIFAMSAFVSLLSIQPLGEQLPQLHCLQIWVTSVVALFLAACF